MSEVPEVRRKMFRRKRKLEGRDIEMEFQGRQIKVTRKDKGIFCRSCGCFKSWGQVEFQYRRLERREGGLARSVICECGDFLKEEMLDA